jgi:heme/copper-type cytochrome/quinol oxidase subunit 3
MTADLALQDRDRRAADVGMWLFVASLVMFFGALFSGYVLLRAGNPSWEAPWATHARAGDPWFRLLWLVVAAALTKANVARPPAASAWVPGRSSLRIAALAGALFCGLTWVAGRGLIASGHGPATGVAAASWFALNGMLGALVGGAAVVTLWVAFATGTEARRALRTRMLGRYWALMAAFGGAVAVGMYLL